MITLRSILTDLSETQINQVVNADVFAGGKKKKSSRSGSSKSLSGKSTSSKSSMSTSSKSSKSSGYGYYSHCGI